MDVSDKETPRTPSFRWGAICGASAAALGVGFGAFGAHALRTALSSDMFAAYESAVRYQMYHAFGMILCALAGMQGGSRAPRRLQISAVLLGTGIVLFSGSLYAMSISGVRSFGVLTPFGGAAFVAGWISFAGAYLSRKRQSTS